jgi:protein gp37
MCTCQGTTTFHRRRVFVESLGDWLDPKVPFEWLAELLEAIRKCQELQFILCSKRIELWKERMQAVYEWAFHHNIALATWVGQWGATVPIVPKNIIILATAETQEMIDKRVPELLTIPAPVHGLSCEPLLGPIELGLTRQQPQERLGMDNRLHQINWVIVGGESGKNARPCNVDWIRDIKDQCAAAEVPCFVKQLGSQPQRGLCVIETIHPKGGDPEEWPIDLQVQQFPPQQ